jgi:S1-C subfamily serine protease
VRRYANVNGLDVFLVVLLVAAAVTGYRRGTTLQACYQGGLLIGFLIGALVAPHTATLFGERSTQAAVAVGTLLVCGALGSTGGWLLGSRSRARARHARSGTVDAVGGSLIAVVAALLAIWFVALNLANGPSRRIAAEVRSSAIVRGLGGALPDPPSVAGEIRRFFDRSGFPEVFAGIPPAPSAPVGTPPEAEIDQAVDVGAASTVKVVGRACDSMQEGSGFVIDDVFVVTSAHVLAGMRQPTVETAEGSAVSGLTVFFDPELDLAVLRLSERVGPSLVLATEEVERGAAGAVLGYPEGGPLVGSGAAVRQPIPALGHDIYGRRDVERGVYELQVQVHPGNSGGPFVLPDGRVAGIVFAASSVDADVGYAIRSTEVLDELVEATSSRTLAETGPCIR